MYCTVLYHVYCIVILYNVLFVWTPWKTSSVLLTELNMGYPSVFIVLYGNKYYYYYYYASV